MTARGRSGAWPGPTLSVRALGVRALGMLALGLGLSGCGHDDLATDAAARNAYHGQLFVPPYQGRHPGAGAAGDVVDCRHYGTGMAAGTDEYDADETTDSPEAAVRTAYDNGVIDGAQHGLVVAARTADRVLYVFEVGSTAKEAVVVHNGPAPPEAGGGPGWVVESWARCDWADFPDSVTEPKGIQVWTGRDGEPASTETIQSYAGPAHCDWDSATFLQLGADLTHSYVRNPTGDMASSLAGPYRDHTALPEDAVATGYQRDGSRLWLASDGSTAYVGADRGDVEAWPRETRPLGCQ
jgi:hypothetical protein